jgi:hypothetical protein
MAQFQATQFTLCSFVIYEDESDEGDESENESDEHLIEALRRIQNLSQPEFLSNQIVDIDDEDVTESVILFADRFPSGPPSPNNLSNHIFVEIDGDGDIHIHAEGDGDAIAEYQSFYEEILEEFGELVVAQLDFKLESEVNFDRLDLPVDRDSKYQIDGVQLTYDGENYIISRQSDDSDETKIQHSVTENETITPEDAGFAEKKLDKVRAFGNQLIKQ